MAKAATKVKVCTRKVREAGKHVKCATEYTGAECPKKNDHLLPMKTGFCNNGWCEGSKAKDWRGNPVPTCEFIVTCPCSCHDQLDKLFAMTDAERIVVDSSGYRLPERTYWMPSDEPLPPRSTDGGTVTHEYVESPAPDTVPASIRRGFTPTPTGRAARGELEQWVKDECDVWLIDKPGEPCTPKYLAGEIARSQAIPPPSVGAISAVFERWVKLGFAVIDKKPTRFVKYTEDGIMLGLDAMKERAKRSKKLKFADDRRNLRR